MNLSSKPIQNPAVLARNIFNDEMVLVNADSGVSLALTNQTAVVVWELIDGKNSVKDIIDGVTHQFQNVPDGVSNDVQELLNELARDGFIGFAWDMKTKNTLSPE